MSLKASTIRLLLLLAVFIAAGTLLLQWRWMQHGYDRERQAFDQRAAHALNQAAADLAQRSGRPMPAAEVRRDAPGHYLLPIDTFLGPETVRELLRGALNGADLTTRFEYALFYGGKVLYQGHGMSGRPTSSVALPAAPLNGYHVGIFFPHRGAASASTMRGWGAATLTVVGMLIALGYFLYLAFQQRRLQEVQKDFVMNMTHEFKTPLASIGLAAEVLKNPAILENPQRLANYAALISAEASRLSAHIDRVLQVNRMGRGTLTLQKSPMVWQDILQQSVRTYEGQVRDKAGRLQLHMPEKAVHFNGDVPHLLAAVGNLIDNAFKYCTECPEIHIFLKIFRKHIFVTVQDNGIGIDRQHRKMLFQKFYRVPTGNVHNVRGYGLGLNYVRIVAGAHGGTVECHSKPGNGASFTMVFPS